MSTMRVVPTPGLEARLLPLLILIGLLPFLESCRTPPELDAVARLPRIEKIERESQRPRIYVTIDDSAEAAIPDDLMAPPVGDRDPRPIDRFRRTFEVAMQNTEHFELVPEQEADFHFALTVNEVKVQDIEEVGFFDWFNYAFFNAYLTSTARIGGALFGIDGEQIGANLERRGQYRILTGKVFRSKPDLFLDLLGTGSSFSKTGSPAAANAVQKAIVKLVADVAKGTEEQEQTGRARQKNADR